MMSGWKRYRVGAVAAISVALVLAWYLFLYQSQLNKESLLRAQQAAINEKVETARARLNKAASISTSFYEVAEKWQWLICDLVSPDSADKIINHVREVAESNSLTVLNMNINFDPLLVKVGTGREIYLIDKVKLNMEGRGRFFAIGDFLTALDEEAIIASIDKVDFTYQEAATPEIYFRLSMQAFILSESGEVL
ncbi:MAG: hypothetical protein KAT58_11595 [candidate division Zixibacteria bacterium]|nr:hypothetical protein [candidate division Zixibacteria bacterium]